MTVCCIRASNGLGVRAVWAIGGQYSTVWSYDFVEDAPTTEGSIAFVLDEFTHESLAIRVARKLKAIDVIDVLSDLFIARGVPARIRSDNGPEFVAKAVREWIATVGAKTAYIAPGSPWENCYIESFNARLRDELLDGEIYYSLKEASDRDREQAPPQALPAEKYGGGADVARCPGCNT
jgi:transposase InsO family protein